MAVDQRELINSGLHGHCYSLATQRHLHNLWIQGHSHYLAQHSTIEIITINNVIRAKNVGPPRHIKEFAD